MSSDFIKPDIYKYNSFEELFNDNEFKFFSRHKSGQEVDFENIVNFKQLFVVAEPGFGKTRLLKETFKKLVATEKQVIFIDLKKVDQDIELYIKSNQSRITPYSENLILENVNQFKSKNFKLKNSKSIAVCLDALDEVKYQDFTSQVERIKFFLKKYKNIHLYISCRYHHFQKNKELFTDLPIDYIRLVPFSEDQVKSYLKIYSLDSTEIDKIIRTLEFRQRDLVIQIPRYLRMVVEVIKEKGASHFLNMKRTDIFDLFIYRKLHVEDKVLNTQSKEIIKRVLEKIALIMETYQSNLITKDELISILDDVKSNLNVSFLNQNTLQIFYDRTVLKDNIDTVEFENTEFQEYLAAKEITRFGKTNQVVFDLVVEKETREIYPSWFNSLGFVVDLEPSILKLLINHVVSQGRIVKSEEYFRFLTKIDADRLQDQDRREIFSSIFNYYQDVLHWIPYDIIRDLAHYFDSSLLTTLNTSLDVMSKAQGEASFVRKGNLAYLIGFLCEYNKLPPSPKSFWISKLNEFLKDDNSVVQRHALTALGKVGDIKNLAVASNLLNANEDLVLECLIEACTEIDPNHSFSIKCYIEGAKRKNIHARYGLYAVTKKSSIKKLLDHLSNDENLLFALIDQESIFKDKDHIILDNIKNIWDKEIFEKVNKVVISAFSNKLWFHAEESKILKELIITLGHKDKDYIFRLIKTVKRNKKLKGNLWCLKNVFPLILHKGQVKDFVKQMKPLNKGTNITLWTLTDTKMTGAPNADEIYEEGRAFFPAEYKSAEDYEKKQKLNKKDPNLSVKQKFKRLLDPGKGKYYPDVFRYYLQHKEQLNIKQKDIDRLKILLIDSVFSKFDPGKQQLTWNKTNGGSTYTTSSYTHVFGHCLKVAVDLNFNVSKYRKRIINYIPFAYSEHLKAIFELAPNPKPEEIKSLLKIYNKKRTDDLATFMPSSFIEASQSYQIHESLPILKKFVDNKKFSIYDRRCALRAINTIKPDKTYFNSVFRNYKTSKKETIQIAEIANELLINNFSDRASIVWRLNQLTSRSIAYVRPKGVHWVPETTAELHEKVFAKPIMSLKNPSFIPEILKLLDNSFKILNKGDDYRAYTNYLWEIVISYFDNLKVYKTFSYFKKLENYVQLNKNKKEINWFTIRLGALLRSYVECIGKPDNVSECIKKYNTLKENQYIDIATPEDLLNIVREIITNDMRSFVEDQGFYKTIQEAKNLQEHLIQKTLKTQFENCFLKRGFRSNEIEIRREEQLLDNNRTDYLISYGFIGPILIELKRNDREEVCRTKDRKAYKKKLIKYIDGTNSHAGIFLIFKINETYDLDDSLSKLNELYKDCDNIEVYGLDCLKSISSETN